MTGKLVNLVLIILILALVAISVFFTVGWLQKRNQEENNSKLAPVPVSGGQIIFEEIDSSATEISVLTQPASAQVLLDGVVKGFTPLKLPAVTVGKHQVSLIYSGYQTRTFNLSVTEGYRVVINLALEKDEALPTQTPATETPL